MKFKIVAKYSYWWPIVVAIPDPEKPGAVIEQKLELLFEPQTRDEATAMETAYAALKTQKERAEHEHDQLRTVSKNWRGVEAVDGGDEPFTPAAFEAAMQHTWFRLAAYKGYRESLFAEASRLGN